TNSSSWTARGRLRPRGPKSAGWRTSEAGTSSDCISSSNFGIVHEGKEVGQGDELAVVETSAHEACVIVPPLLAIGEHVDLGASLRGHREPRRVLAGGGELLFGQPSLDAVGNSLQHRARRRPPPAAP